MTRRNIPNEKLHGNKAYAWFAAGKSASPETPKRKSIKSMISNKKVVAIIGLMVVATITICAKLASSDANKTCRESEEKNEQRLKSINSVAIQPVNVVVTNTFGKVRGKRRWQHKRLGERAIQSGGSSGESNVVVMSAEEEIRLSFANRELTPDIMKELTEIFAQVSETNFVGTQFVQTLSNYKPSIVIEAAQHVLKNGSVEEKGNALYAVGMLFGKESATGIPFDMTHPKAVVMRNDEEGAGDPSGSENVEDVAPPPVRPSNELISVVSVGLFDEDKGVRDVAFDVMRSLPDEESGILAANLVSDGDVALQRRLMLEDGENNIRLSLVGMGSESQEVRSLAAANIKNLTGQEFVNQQVASEWYKAHYNEFPQGVEKSASEHEAINKKGENK